jgi:BASS family bile acid:Na+ symporter
MLAIIQRIADLSLLAFAVSSMLAMGMSERLALVAASVSKPLPVALALAVNFVVAPLLAVALSRLVPLQPAHATGLLLLGSAAGAPFLPKLAEIAHGNLAYALAVMVLLMTASIVLMPLMLPAIVPGLDVDAWGIAEPLLIILVVPLVIGFALGTRDRMAPLLGFARRVANLSFLLLLVLMVALNLRAMLGMFGSFAIATYSLFVLAMVGVGYAVGAADRTTQSVFALCAGNRNVAAALVVSGTSLDDPAVTVMLLAASIVGLLLLLAIARGLRVVHARA